MERESRAQRSDGSETGRGLRRRCWLRPMGTKGTFPRRGGGQESRVKRKEIPKRGCGDFWGHLDDIQMTLAYEPGTHAVV